ncbi:MAG: hypothetical protein JRI59_08135 [Deltaproteobacteria bacterium]|nr:hypothetical protein [Deltaproteobacteria bacterium]
MMKGYLPDVILLVLGVLVMVLLLALGALSRTWVALLCFLGVAVVYHTWYRHLIQVVQKGAGIEEPEEDDDDDQDIFPTA